VPNSITNFNISNYSKVPNLKNHLHYQLVTSLNRNNEAAVGDNGAAVDNNGAAVDNNGVAVDNNGATVDNNGATVNQSVNAKYEPFNLSAYKVSIRTKRLILSIIL